MGVLICGRKIRINRPIRLNDFLRMLSLSIFMFLAFLPKGHADTLISNTNQQSKLSPAYALALALGVQNIAGPMTYSPADDKKNHKIISHTNDRRAPHLPQDVGYTTTISMNTRPPQPDME